MSRHVLVVDDDTAMCEMIVAWLEERGYQASFVTSAEAALDFLASTPIDVVVSDLNMRGASGADLCKRVVGGYPDIPVVIITASGSVESAVETMRAGAFDFLTKPFEIEELVLAIDRAQEHGGLRREVRRLAKVVKDHEGFGELLGQSEVMRRLYDLMDRVSQADASVLITGESGTGKELVARELHARGRRNSGPFVAVNCAALPDNLLESELFGHEKGAFTDAHRARRGLFLEAHGGTLFLDEIGEMALGVQAKLLRSLETRRVRPVGASSEQPFDASILCATHRNLSELVEDGKFREDLFYRIHVVEIPVPPLRQRESDILLLAQTFLSRASAKMGKNVTRISSAAAGKLLGYTWPGNVRELQNCMERAVVLARYDEITVDELPEPIRDHADRRVLVPATGPGELVPMDEVERRYILHVLDATGGNKALAARTLGYDRKTLYRRLERYGLSSGDRQSES